MLSDFWGALLIGLAGGWVISFLWTIRKGERIVPRIRKLLEDIEHDYNDLLVVNDLTETQKKTSLRSVTTLEKLLQLYEWADEQETRQYNRETIFFFIPPRWRDPVRLTAQAIICETFLGLTREDASKALPKVKSCDDYRRLMPSKSPQGLARHSG